MVGKKTDGFAKTISFLIGGTLALMVGLAWNDYAVNIKEKYTSRDNSWTFLAYALLMTIFAVLVVFFMKTWIVNGNSSDNSEIVTEQPAEEFFTK